MTASLAPQTPLGPLDFAAAFGVPRETVSRLSTYVEMLKDWNARVNLVADSTLSDPWRRHILDSAQLLEHVPESARKLVDLGSGAGFPGMVLAIMLAPHSSCEIHLIDSTKKKCSFLSAVSAATGVAVHVHWSRAEAIENLTADVITARAVAPLKELLELAFRFWSRDSIALFLKGKSAEQELTLATKSWKLDYTPFPSKSDPSGTVLRVTGLAPWRTPPKQP